MYSRHHLESPKRGTYLDYLQDPAPWFRALSGNHVVHNVLRERTNIPIFVVLWDGQKLVDWIEVAKDNALPSYLHFESFYEQRARREAHYLSCIEQASREKRTVARELNGCWDLFTPLPMADGVYSAFLFAGHFLAEEPHLEGVNRGWSDLTGEAPLSGNPDFIAFVKMMLNLPVFSGEMFEVFKEFMESYATILGQGERAGHARDRIVALHTEHFTRLWPVDDLVRAVVDSNKFVMPTWLYEGAFSGWIKEAMGITRAPTTAMVLMPLDPPDSPSDPVSTLLRNARIQRACLSFLRDVPEVAACAYQDFGVTMLTSARTGRTAAQARADFSRLARKARKFAKESLGIDCVVGIGRSMTPGAPLHASLRDAAYALHLCIQQKKSQLFFDAGKKSGDGHFAGVQHAAQELSVAFDRANDASLGIAMDRYVRLALLYSNQRLEVIRSQFLTTVFLLYNQVNKRQPVREEARETFVNTLVRHLEESRTVEQAVHRFNATCKHLRHLSTRGWQGPSEVVLQIMLDYIQENYDQGLTLPIMAKKFGASIPVFTRAFKEATGTSFLSYLRAIRIERAKTLLTTTRFSLVQVAHAVGYHSAHQLIHAFKTVTQQTPGSYRKRNTPRSMVDVSRS